MVCGSMVLAQGRFRRQIGTESCYRVGLQAYQLQQLLGLAAVDTSSSSFMLVALPYFAVFCRILLAIIFCHILPSSAVDTGRFERVEDGEHISIIGTY